MPEEYTMPDIPQNFPDMSNEQVWVWDSWPLTDENANQYSVNGQEIIFSLVADRSLGFDDRHVYAKIGYFYRPAGISADQRPENGGWTYGGLVFDEGEHPANSLGALRALMIMIMIIMIIITMMIIMG